MITRKSVHVAVVTSGCVTKCVIIGTTTIGAGGDWFPQILGWGANNALVPQLLGRSFQKARNFTASSHQNAGFSI